MRFWLRQKGANYFFIKLQRDYVTVLYLTVTSIFPFSNLSGESGAFHIRGVLYLPLLITIHILYPKVQYVDIQNKLPVDDTSACCQILLCTGSMCQGRQYISERPILAFMQPCLLGAPSAAWRHADRRIGNLLGGASLRPFQNKINCCAGSGGAYGSALGKGKRTGRFPGAALQLWHIFTAGAILPKVIWELSEQLIYHEIPPQLWSKKGGSISSGTCKCITR